MMANDVTADSWIPTKRNSEAIKRVQAPIFKNSSFF